MKKLILLLSAVSFLSVSAFAGYDCNSCQGGMSKAKSERLEKYSNLSPKERKALKEKYSNLSPEERKALKEKYSNLSPEERKALKQQRIEKFKSKDSDPS